MSARRTWADRLLDRSLPDGPTGDAIRGDLKQERDRRADRDGQWAAQRWYTRQAASIWFFATRDRFRGRGWHSGRALAGGGSAQAYGRRSPAAGSTGLGDIGSDLRDGVRVLRRAPAYSSAVVLTLGVAMAATVSVFTIVRGVLLTDLPFPDPDALVRIDATDEDAPSDGGLPYPTFQDWQSRMEGVAQMAAFQMSEGVYVADGVTELWSGVAATREFLPLLGVQPLLGSFYAQGEGLNGEHSIYLSQHIWERRFGADPGIVGRTIEFYEQSWVVRGVMPRRLAFPTTAVDYWMPLRESPFLSNRGAGFMRAVGRLAPGVSVGVANQEMDALTLALNEEFETPGEAFLIRGIADVERAPVKGVLWIFLGAVGFFLLVACANVAGLALARTESRRRELSVRLSIGASGYRLTRQLLVESTMLALIGGGLGLVGAFAGVRGMLALAPADLPRREAIVIDPMVVAFALAVAVAAGILFGVLPGLRGARIAGAKPDSSRSTTRSSRRTHKILAGAQVALAVVLLSGSALLLRSFSALNAVETGFSDAEQLLMVELGLGREDYSTAEQVTEFHRQLLQGIADLPTVEAVGLSTHLPFSGSMLNATVVREGDTYVRGPQNKLMSLEVVNGDYRTALGLPLLRGRDPIDDPGGPPSREILMNQAGANMMWPGQEAVGKRFSFDLEPGQIPAEDSYFTVVGVLPNVMDGGLDSEVLPRAYFGFDGFRKQYQFITGRFFYTVIRTTGDPYALVESVREVVRRLDPTAPLHAFSSLEQMIRTTTVPARFRTVTLTVFATLAVIVALLGVYGVMAYGVATGIRDIGIRMALGAQSTSVRTQVLRQAFVVVAAGGLAGVIAAGALGPLLGSMLFGVSDRDPVTLGGVLLLAVAGSLAAAYLPALRASRVDPNRVLRQD